MNKDNNEPYFEDEIQLSVSEQDYQDHKRLDHFLAQKLDQYSRSFLKNLFTSGLITSDQSVKLELKKMPSTGSVITVSIPPPLPSTAQPEDIPLDILYEDEHLLIVNKPAGLVTHPAPGHPGGTLVNAVLFHCLKSQEILSGIGDQRRPGIVHRLDKGTSGVMVVAKNQKTHEGLVLLFSRHDIERRYEAIVVTGHKLKTHLSLSGKLEGPIGRHPTQRLKMAVNNRNGKEAITHYSTNKQFTSFSHMGLKLETGRTHQIRVHLSQILGTPILNDPLYSSPKNHLKKLPENIKDIISDYTHPFLHAKILGFIHPITGEKLYFEIPPPKIFQTVLEQLEICDQGKNHE